MGAWEVVDVPDGPVASSSSADGPGAEEGTGQAGGEVHAGEKRAAEAMAPAPAEEQHGRGHGHGHGHEKEVRTLVGGEKQETRTDRLGGGSRGA